MRTVLITCGARASSPSFWRSRSTFRSVDYARSSTDLKVDRSIERIGVTLMGLEQRMQDLCAHFELSLDDLNLDLGPLGTLLPPERQDP